MKLGQFLSLRYDFLPLYYLTEFLEISNQTPEEPFSNIQDVFVKETGKTVGEFFSEFNAEPVAVGTISQVYFARFKDSPRSAVAVKIQRPNIKELFEIDFSLIYFFATIVRAVAVATEFINWTKNELDFTYEAKNAAILYEHSKEHPRTIIPKQYLEITTPRVLIQEFIEGGILLEDILLKKKKADFDDLAEYLIKDHLRQYFIDGFFHFNPHPANLIFKPASQRGEPENKLAYLNFGIVGPAFGGAKEDRLLLLKSFYGLAKNDVDFLSENFFKFNQKKFNENVEFFLQVDLVKRRATEKIIEKIKELILIDFKKDIGEIMNDKSFPLVLRRLGEIAEKYGVILPREITLFFCTLSFFNTITLQISPTFDIIKALNSFFEEYPLEKAEGLIKEGLHKKEVGEKIIPLMNLDWEFFKEVSALEKEKKEMIKEKMMEMIFYYAEKYEEVKSLIKNI